MTDALNHAVRYEYDALNRRTKVIYADNTTETTAYDSLGHVTAKTDQANKTTRSEYDALGRLVKVTDAVGQVTNYGYDEIGHQVAQIDANNHRTRYEYDTAGRRIKRVLPSGSSETYQYDAVTGLLQTKTDFLGKTTTYSYDTLGRLLQKRPDASLNQPAISFTYTTAGQRSTMTDASGITHYGYDGRGRLETKQTPQGTLSYTYDAMGNLASTASSNTNGASVAYAYDTLNRLSTVTDNRLSAGANQTTYSYDAVGNLQGYVYPNAVSTSYAYNTLNRLTTATIGTASTSLASYAYTLGAAGNRTSVTEKSGRTVAYTYDDLYRLTNETIANDANAYNNGTLGYTYDAVGNRLKRTSTVSTVTAQTSAYDVNDRLTSETYDANGNTRQAANGSTYDYDFENHLTNVNGTVTYLYDGDGNRVAKTEQGLGGAVTTKYLVDTNNPTGYAQVVEELRGGSVTRRYTFGHSLISQTQVINNAWQTSFYDYDGHGSTRLLTDAAGTVTDTYDYDAFGNLLASTGNTPNPSSSCSSPQCLREFAPRCENS